MQLQKMFLLVFMKRHMKKCLVLFVFDKSIKLKFEKLNDKQTATNFYVINISNGSFKEQYDFG